MTTAFAVFCETDGSLTFYKRDTVPTAGSTFEGKEVTNVYTGVETDVYSKLSAIPWSDSKKSIKSVSFVDVIAPVSTKYWFASTTSLDDFNAKNLDTSKVTDMSYMFRQSGITNLDVSGFDVSSVTTFKYMFAECNRLANLNTDGWANHGVVTDMSRMCYWSVDIVSVDLSGLDTSTVTDMSSAFDGCEHLKTIYVSDKWSTASVTSGDDMFLDTYELVGGNGTTYDEGRVDATYARIDKPGEPGYFTYKKYYPLETRREYLIKGTTWYDIAESVRGLVDSTELMNPNKVIQTISNIGHAEEVKW